MGPLRRGSRTQESPQDGAHDARQFVARTWMCVQRTPESANALAGQDARRARRRGGLLFGHFLLATQEKVTRSPQVSESFFSH